MKIIKYKKLNINTYRLYLEDEELDLAEDLIVKYEILLLKEIDNKLKKKLIEENKIYEAYNMAIKYLKNKMRCTYEIKKHLKEKLINDDIIDEVVKKLTNSKYLDDELYIILFINDRIKLSNDGPFKIRISLLELELDSNLIEEELERFNDSLEKERINKLIEKKVRLNNNKSSLLLKQKIIKELMDLGYTKDYIVLELDNFDLHDKEIYEKERKKIYDKLSKKYEGDELEYKVKAELYRKGFRE